ncbi:MAG: ABC transporter permease [Oligoflexus sp.]|jgi:ABC-2 type transport system permease protein
MPELSKWMATVRISWSKHLAYKLNFVLLVIGPTLVFFFVKFSLWKAIFSLEGVTTLQGYDLRRMLNYQAWTLLVGLLAQGYNSMNLAEDIRLGRISAYLVYPFGFWPFQTASFLAFQGLQLLVSAVTLLLLVVGGLLSGWSWPALLEGFVFSLLVGFFWYQISFLIGLAAFWLEETWVLRVMFVTIAQFLSGAMMPLEVFPVWLESILQWSPFPYLTYVPAKMFMGEYSGSFAVAALILGLWLAVVSLGVNWVWRRGLRLYTAAGM